MLNKTVNQRFESKIVKEYNPEGCWLWNASKEKGGYGSFWNGKNICKAHRYSYELFREKIPKDLCVLHTCDNRWCVNPEHLWLGTYQDNAIDMVKKGRHCDVNGAKNGRAKLSTNDIYQIKKDFDDGMSVTNIANRLGVWNTTVYDILNRETWKKC